MTNHQVTRTLPNGIRVNYESDYGLTLEADGSRLFSVEVIKPCHKWGGQLCGAEVNWSAFGSRLPEDAIVYATLLTQAYAEAQRLNREAGL